MTEEHYNQNQTQFTADEPLLEQPIQPVVTPTDPAPIKKSPPKWLVPAIVGVGVITLLIILIALRSRSEINLPPESVVQPPPARELSPLELRLEEIRLQLRAANPTLQELPFPPLDMQLKIDDAR